jgi:hypothetical protein
LQMAEALSPGSKETLAHDSPGDFCPGLDGI